ALEDVFQFPDISGPAVFVERADGVGGEARYFAAYFGGKFREQGVREQGNVLFPFPERRKVNGDDLEAVEQVLAERMVADGFGEIAVRRGDGADVDDLRARASDGKDFAGLEKAEEFHLAFGRHFADLV